MSIHSHVSESSQNQAVENQEESDSSQNQAVEQEEIVRKRTLTISEEVSDTTGPEAPTEGQSPSPDIAAIASILKSTSPVVLENFKLTPNDTRDPSYSNLDLPYRVVCRQRLHRTAKEMEDMYFQELTHFQLFQTVALDGVRVRRAFNNNFTSIAGNKLITLTKKQKFRLEQLLAAP